MTIVNWKKAFQNGYALLSLSFLRDKCSHTLRRVFGKMQTCLALLTNELGFSIYLKQMERKWLVLCKWFQIYCKQNYLYWIVIAVHSRFVRHIFINIFDRRVIFVLFIFKSVFSLFIIKCIHTDISYNK